jgi:hypothetical protein
MRPDGATSWTVARMAFCTSVARQGRGLERPVCQLERLGVQPERELAWERLEFELPRRAARYSSLFLLWYFLSRDDEAPPVKMSLSFSARRFHP